MITSIRERLTDLKTRLEQGFKQPGDTLDLVTLFHELVVHLEGQQPAQAAAEAPADEQDAGPAA